MAVRRQRDVSLTICLYAARMNIGGICATDGVRKATDAMKLVLQTLTSTGFITSWGALSVDQNTVELDVLILPAGGSVERHRFGFHTASLTPENEAALEVMCG